MVILGLGSNTGERLNQLRQALQQLKNTDGIFVEQVSPVYISDALLPEGAPAEWNNPYLNCAVRCTTSLEPQDLLRAVKKIEASVGRVPQKKWGPRIIDIDILAWDHLVIDEANLHIPHQFIHERPFALWPLADLDPMWIYPVPGPLQGKTASEMAASWGSRFEGTAPLHTRQINQRIDTPQLVGILNITPDSFSDGGHYTDPRAAVIHAEKLVETGAEIIDIGAESTRPNAILLNAHDEWARLEPVLQLLKSKRDDFLIAPQISIDTRHAEVAKKALALGIDWINDVSSFTDADMLEVLKQSTAKIVLMHHLSIPADKNHFLPRDKNPIPLIYSWAQERIAMLEKQGIAPERIIFDVGVGYGKTAEQDFYLLKNISAFVSLKVPLLVGHSRKYFFSLATAKPPAERDVETIAAAIYLAKHDLTYMRVHNVDAIARALKITAML